MPNTELESIDRQITSENDRHRNRVEQLRRQKQRVKDAQAKKREQEKLQKTYKECINDILAILVSWYILPFLLNRHEKKVSVVRKAG